MKINDIYDMASLSLTFLQHPHHMKKELQKKGMPKQWKLS